MDINFVLNMVEILKMKKMKIAYFKYIGEDYSSLLEDEDIILDNIICALDLLDKEQLKELFLKSVVQILKMSL
jgi:hypothetical protein